MIAVVLAAGKSTRLRPLTKNLPKPMLKVAGRPMLEHIIQKLRFYGFIDIVITTHYCADKITNFFGDGSKFGVRIRYAHETELMDTAGSLKLSELYLREDFLVVGGNSLLPTLNFKALHQFHIEQGGIGTIVFKHLMDEALLPLFGIGELDSDQRLVKFQEKSVQATGRLIHTTYQYYSPKVLEFIPSGMPYSIPQDLIPRLLASDEKIYGYITPSDFVCISTPELYRQANELTAVGLKDC